MFQSKQSSNPLTWKEIATYSYCSPGECTYMYEAPDHLILNTCISKLFTNIYLQNKIHILHSSFDDDKQFILEEPYVVLVRLLCLLLPLNISESLVHIIQGW